MADQFNNTGSTEIKNSVRERAEKIVKDTLRAAIFQIIGEENLAETLFAPLNEQELKDLTQEQAREPEAITLLQAPGAHSLFEEELNELLEEEEDDEGMYWSKKKFNQSPYEKIIEPLVIDHAYSVVKAMTADPQLRQIFLRERRKRQTQNLRSKPSDSIPNSNQSKTISPALLDAEHFLEQLNQNSVRLDQPEEIDQKLQRLGDLPSRIHLYGQVVSHLNYLTPILTKKMKLYNEILALENQNADRALMDRIRSVKKAMESLNIVEKNSLATSEHLIKVLHNDNQVREAFSPQNNDKALNKLNSEFNTVLTVFSYATKFESKNLEISGYQKTLRQEYEKAKAHQQHMPSMTHTHESMFNNSKPIQSALKKAVIPEEHVDKRRV